MKKICLILVVGIVTGCFGSPALIEVRQGVYAVNEVADLPLPTSGYDVYIVGEMHGLHEISLLFLEYLKMLHESTGLQIVALEEDQSYEEDANEYISGATDILRVDLCLRANILKGIRWYNETLPENEKIYVHLVDLDSPLSAIHEHILDIHEEIGAGGIDIPSLEEFEEWNEDDARILVEQLKEAAKDPESINQLETVEISLSYYYAGNRIEIGPVVGFQSDAPIREEAITQNMQYLVKELQGQPVLALFGSWHAQKSLALINPSAPDCKSWAMRLTESGVSIYSVFARGLSGKGYWRDERYDVELNAHRVQFADGTTLSTVLGDAPDYSILYVDLRVDENSSALLGNPFRDIPAGEIYDAFVVFRDVTPMENACS
ncbi:MAG: hypothetical protein HXS46_00745 [Theionarchaea archaeon]|nr:hypothetical protein [Theionarchaea archaeon]